MLHAPILQKLLADTPALDKVLEYHVLPGHFTMRDLMSVQKAQTLEGSLELTLV